MGGSEEAGLDARGTANRVEYDGSGTLAVSAGDLYCRIGALGIPESVKQQFSVLQAQLNGQRFVAKTEKIAKRLVVLHG
jgi:hypothetical protein